MCTVQCAVFVHRICCNVISAIKTVILLHVLCFTCNVSWVLLSLCSFLFAIFGCCYCCYCCLWLRMKVHQFFFSWISVGTFLWFPLQQQTTDNAVNGYCGRVRNTNSIRTLVFDRIAVWKEHHQYNLKWSELQTLHGAPFFGKCTIFIVIQKKKKEYIFFFFLFMKYDCNEMINFVMQSSGTPHFFGFMQCVMMQNLKNEIIITKMTQRSNEKLQLQ